MKKHTLSKLFLGVALVGLTFTSCNEKSETKNSDTTENTTTPTATSEGASEEEEVKLNPQHGLPGHRCDLPVGAPLPSGSAATATPASTQPQVNPNVSPIRMNNNPTINPPHGEPGHDCAVPVGAPLK